MYNRYARNDSGLYERIPVTEHHAPPPEDQSAQQHTVSDPGSAPVSGSTSGQSSPLAGLLGKGGLLSGILDKLKLSDIDTGDLLLLLILFLLFRDGEDDELLIALGLLLIL